MTHEEAEFVSYVVELMQPLGPVRPRRMFGGYGFFLDGLMFALVADATLYLKADSETEDDFRSNGLERFTYKKKGKQYSMSYYQAPADAIEDAETMNEWANKAYSAALRAAKEGGR